MDRIDSQEYFYPSATGTPGGTVLLALRTHALRIERRLEYIQSLKGEKFGNLR